MVATPNWRTKPVLIIINCETVQPNQDEFVVKFRTQDGPFVSFVPKEYVNEDTPGIYGAIIADVEGGVLVDIPRDTFSSGSRIFVSSDLVPKLLTEVNT